MKKQKCLAILLHIIDIYDLVICQSFIMNIFTAHQFEDLFHASQLLMLFGKNVLFPNNYLQDNLILFLFFCYNVVHQNMRLTNKNVNRSNNKT